MKRRAKSTGRVYPAEKAPRQDTVTVAADGVTRVYVPTGTKDGVTSLALLSVSGMRIKFDDTALTLAAEFGQWVRDGEGRWVRR